MKVRKYRLNESKNIKTNLNTWNVSTFNNGVFDIKVLEICV